MSTHNVSRCLVMISGSSEPRDISFYDTIICADSGAKSLVYNERGPDFLIGDMDSISSEDLDILLEKGASLIAYPEDKSSSDGELAVRLAVSLTPQRIDITGGKSGRADHLLSSFHLLHLIPRGMASSLILDRDQIFLVRDGEEMIFSSRRPVVSVLPASDPCRVTIIGLKWDLLNELLEIGSTRGIHNENRKGRFSVRAEEGELFVILSEEGS